MLGVSLTILYLFPKSGQFRYEYQKGRVWQYPSLYAPFDFSILKSVEDLEVEQNKIKNSLYPYFRVDLKIKDSVFANYEVLFFIHFSIPHSRRDQ